MAPMNSAQQQITSTRQYPVSMGTTYAEMSHGRSGDISTDLLLAAAFLPRYFKPGATPSLWAHPTRVPRGVM